MPVPFAPRLDNYHAVSTQLANHLIARSDTCFARAAADQGQLTTPEDVRRFQQTCRDTFITALGGFPDDRGDIDATEPVRSPATATRSPN